MTQKKTAEGYQAEDYMFGEDALIERLTQEKQELLEALERIEPIIRYLNEANDCNPEYDEMIGPQIPEIEKQVTQAIAKAKGETNAD